MDDTEAVNCSASDAEAVLLALGARLVWLQYENTRSEWWNGSHEDRAYRVNVNTEGSHAYVEAMQFHTSYEKCLIKFPNLAEAKAACERHYATGKWD